MFLKFYFSLFLAVAVFTAVAKAQNFVGSVRVSLDRNNVPEAQAKLEQYKQARGITPEYLEAYSWLGRDALTRGNYQTALKFADETYALCLGQLKARKLDADDELPTALGAAIEVHGQALAKLGQAVKAQQYLYAELAKYRSTSIAPRIQKNINLLGLAGRVAPALELQPHLGPTPPSLSSLRGKPVILFLWAHWCADCKAQAPILARLKQELGDKIAIVGPTQRYGYAAYGAEASPANELEYIDSVRKKYYSSLADMPVPVSSHNFQQYGVSTTPTLVLIAKDGKVALYHPGRMTYDELKTELSKLM
jgi:thiol-disulfide isomerase/thioredoxin